MRRLMRPVPGQPGPPIAAGMSPEEAVEMLRFCFADLWDPDAPAAVSHMSSINPDYISLILITLNLTGLTLRSLQCCRFFPALT